MAAENSPDQDAFYEARRALDEAGRGNTDARDNTPAAGGWPAPDIKDIGDGDYQPLMRNAIHWQKALAALWERGTTDPFTMMRAATTIRYLRAAWGELSPNGAVIDPRWSEWLLAWDEGIAQSIPLTGQEWK